MTERPGGCARLVVVGGNVLVAGVGDAAQAGCAGPDAAAAASGVKAFAKEVMAKAVPTADARVCRRVGADEALTPSARRMVKDDSLAAGKASS